MTRTIQQPRNVSGGIMLIGLGVLFLTDWFWPGIMFVIGLAWAADLWLKGETRQAAGIFLLFLLLPAALTVVEALYIPWAIILPLALIGFGLFSLAKAISQR
jgi:hypothetical protein